MGDGRKMPGRPVAAGSAAGTTAITCGQRWRAPTGNELTLSGTFPDSTPAGQPAVAGTVEVSSRVAVRGTAAPRADMFLVRDGRVVSVPGPQDLVGVRWELAPGATRQVPGEVSLVSCAPGGGPLPPGRYDLYARMVIIADDGTRAEAFGGPWTLDVR